MKAAEKQFFKEEYYCEPKVHKYGYIQRKIFGLLGTHSMPNATLHSINNISMANKHHTLLRGMILFVFALLQKLNYTTAAYVYSSKSCPAFSHNNIFHPLLQSTNKYVGGCSHLSDCQQIRGRSSIVLSKPTSLSNDDKDTINQQKIEEESTGSTAIILNMNARSVTPQLISIE